VTGLGLVVAFLGGVVSFASPCCLPLVPAYVSYMVGTTAEGAVGRRQAFLHGLAFVAGFSLIFIAFWASIGVIGSVLAENARYLRQLGGALLIFLGLHVAGVINVSLLWREVRLVPALGGTGQLGVPPAAAPGYRRSLLFGTFFAAGWSPCIGPILGGILGLASASASFAQGTALLVAYALGLAVPFLAVALGASSIARRLGWVGRHQRAVSLVSGALLVAIGVLMVTNMLSRLVVLTAPLAG
jgi:cytochrome c-type biogenesis protein